MLSVLPVRFSPPTTSIMSSSSVLNQFLVRTPKRISLGLRPCRRRWISFLKEQRPKIQNAWQTCYQAWLESSPRLMRRTVFTLTALTIQPQFCLKVGRTVLCACRMPVPLTPSLDVSTPDGVWTRTTYAPRRPAPLIESGIVDPLVLIERLTHLPDVTLAEQAIAWVSSFGGKTPDVLSPG